MKTELKDTVELMCSEDYVERFAAEYIQLAIRTEKLYDLVTKYEADQLDFEPECKLALLKKQLKAMQNYLYAMDVRANVENIYLGKYMREED